MDLEQAKQFLSDLSGQWSQPEDRKQAFREWQQNASPETLAELDEWHQQLLMRQKGALDTDPELLASNQRWLEEKISHLPEGEKEEQRRPGRVRYILRFAAAAIVTGLIAFGAYLSIHRQPSPALTPALQASPGLNAVLTLASGRQLMLAELKKGNITTEGGVNIQKLDSGLLGYTESSAASTKGGTPGDTKGGMPGAAKGGAAGGAAVAYNTLTTGKGGRFGILLPDGSHVWLNSNATLTYPISFSGSARNVELNGEAYFEIVKNAAAPFVVRAGGMDVQVMGTGFDVMAYADEAAVITTLVEGAVAVSKGAKKIIIKPGEQAQITRGTDSLRVNRANMEEALAWRQGEFRFKKANIQTIMRQMARWYDIKVIYSGAVSTAPFTGVMTRKEEFRQLLEVLEISGDVHFRVTGNTISVVTGQH